MILEYLFHFAYVPRYSTVQECDATKGSCLFNCMVHTPSLKIRCTSKNSSNYFLALFEYRNLINDGNTINNNGIAAIKPPITAMASG
jgi:hypothetical protein